VPDAIEIPVIDLAPFLAGAPEGADVVRAIRSACEQIGFFCITGHGVPDATIERIKERSRAFFDQADAAKRRSAPPGTVPGGVTYSPVASEALAASRGEQTPGDLKQMLDYGPGWPGNDWPAEPAGLRESHEAYYAALGVLAGHLRRAFALAAGLPEDAFEPSFANHLSSLRVIDYPEPTAPPEPGQLRAGAHSDYGFVTILLSQASAGGLQAQSRAGDWIDVPALDGAYVVNIADALMRMTNDRWVSTPHRVVNPPAGASNTRRQSIPYFHNPDPDAIVRCLEPFVSAERPARYAPISYAEYAQQMADATHGAAAGVNG
jgi:isopenicillin N synthase-like dioxygenase